MLTIFLKMKILIVIIARLNTKVIWTNDDDDGSGTVADDDDDDDDDDEDDDADDDDDDEPGHRFNAQVVRVDLDNEAGHEPRVEVTVP